MLPKIAIIGAGVSGLSAALSLQSEGFSVSVFEKNPFIGGRLRYSSQVNNEVDYGAQYLTVRTPKLHHYVSQWQREGWVAPWAPKLLVVGESESRDKRPSSNLTRWVAKPTMAHLADNLASNLTVLVNHQVDAILCLATREYQLRFTSGKVSEVFSHVIFALPATEILPLLGDLNPVWRESLSQVKFSPTIGALIKPKTPLPCEAAFINQGILRWLASNSSKPGRSQGLAWTLHLDGQWSALNWHESDTGIAAAIEKDWQQLAWGPLEILEIFRWPLALSEVLQERGEFWDENLRLGAAGDWVSGGRVEGAFMAGHEISQRILPSLGQESWMP